RQHDWLKSFLKQTHNIQNSIQKQVRPIASAANALKQKVEFAFSELETLYSGIKMPGRLESLLRVKVLETLLFAPAKLGTALGQYSVVGMEGNFAAAKAIVEYQKNLPHTAYFADILLAGSQSPNSAIFKKWQNFLLSLEPLAEEKKISAQQILRLKEIIDVLQQANILPVYMTLFFESMQNKNLLSSFMPFFFDNTQNDPLLALENLLASFPKKDEQVLFEILKQKKAILKDQANLSGFSDSDTFEKAFQSLQNRQRQILREGAFQGLLTRENWDDASSSVRFAALEMLKDFIDTFDLAIKAMRRGTHSKEREVQLFKRMLMPYFSLLQAMTNKILPPDAFVKIPNQLDTIERILKDLPDTDPEQLHPSADFSVAAAVFGSRARFDEHYPKYLEDVFTLIHQNLLAINGWLTNQMISQESIAKAIPETLSRALSNLEKVGGNGVGMPQRSETKISPKKIELYYNIPLRDHSGTLIFIYNKKTDSIEIEARFLGDGAEGSRWQAVKESAEILSLLGFLPLSKPIQVNKNEICIVWKVSDQKTASILDFYQLLVEMSLGNRDPLEECVLSQLKASIKKGRAYQETTIEAAKHLAHMDPEKTVKLFEKFIEKGQAYQEAIEVAKNFIQIKDPTKYHYKYIAKYPYKAVNLFKKLIEKGQGYQEAIEAAKYLIQTDPSKGDYMQYGVELFKKLIEKGQGYQEAIEAAKCLIQTDPSKGYYMQHYGVNLFEKLVEKGQGYQEAIEVAKGFGRVVLFKKLIEKGQAYQEAIEAAKDLIQTGSSSEVSFGINLFEKLLEKGHGYREVLSFIQSDPAIGAQLSSHIVYSLSLQVIPLYLFVQVQKYINNIV
ncbi:MAG: hypothetical protein K940chlam6_01222, partial [Chlamydiae bacterium]|nr:hypothetical protein [Chlamydiota bacterium]